MYNKAEKRSRKTKQISAYFAIDFARDMCHIHTAGIPKYKLLKRLCRARGKTRGKFVFFLRSLASVHCGRLFLVLKVPLFCLATAFNAMFPGMF